MDERTAAPGTHSDRLAVTRNELVLPDRLCLTRKTFELGPDVLTSAELSRRTAELLANRPEPSRNADGEYEALDRYWARERAFYLSHAFDVGRSYDDYLPGRCYTYRRVADVILKHAADRHQLRVLDVGCGSALASRYLRDHIRDYVALDVSAMALAFAMALGSEVEAPIRAVLAAADQIPVQDEAIDVSYSLGLLEHFDHAMQARIVREMRRVTCGAIVIVVPNTECAIFRAMCELESKNAGADLTFPLEEHYYPVDFERLATSCSLTLVEHDAFHLVPPKRLPLAQSSDAERDLFIELAERVRYANGNAAEAWWVAEDSVGAKRRQAFAWFRYGIFR